MHTDIAHVIVRVAQGAYVAPLHRRPHPRGLGHVDPKGTPLEEACVGRRSPLARREGERRTGQLVRGPHTAPGKNVVAQIHPEVAT
ncbi:MAG TPA: hypothetical protein VGI26_06375 [Solirubrobacteraceae bacterium]